MALGDGSLNGRREEVRGPTSGKTGCCGSPFSTGFPKCGGVDTIWPLVAGRQMNGLLMLASLGDELREMEERQETKQEAESLLQVMGALAPGLPPSCYQ